MTSDRPDRPDGPRHRIARDAYGIVYAEDAAFKDTYGGTESVVFLESYRLRPLDGHSDTVLLFMHPVGGGAYLPMVTELAKHGNHVIYAGSRYCGVDSALIMEKVVLDDHRDAGRRPAGPDGRRTDSGGRDAAARRAPEPTPRPVRLHRRRRSG